jgi:CspA family cold shock protein
MQHEFIRKPARAPKKRYAIVKKASMLCASVRISSCVNAVLSCSSFSLDTNRCRANSLNLIFILGKHKMATGTVKWFNDAKGFGFITPDGGGEDLFAHFSAIKADGFKTLRENQRVSYEEAMGPKGKQAANIIPE